jgi:hypothetical protein
MCKIIKIKYVSPDGRRRTTERKELCFRSDGINPCLYQEVSEVTELVSSGTPSLVGDDISTPATTSGPGTPLTATANYEYRVPRYVDDNGESSSKSRNKGKFKTFVPYLSIGGKKSKPSSPTSPSGMRRRSDHASRSGSSNGDVDSIIGIEEDGRYSPISPTRTRFSLGSPLSMRRAQPPPLVSQPKPPTPLSMRSSTPAPPYHRRTFTEPDATVRFDTEVTDRANAREMLRRENRERSRLQDDVRRKQEADDRKLAEDLDAKERRERAADEFSMMEYARLQERDKRRLEKAAAVLEKSDQATQDEIDELEKEIKEMKQQEDERRELKRRDEARRRERLLRDEESRIEHRLQEDLAKIRRDREASNTLQLSEIQQEIDRLESELVKQQERRQARERAEQLEQEIRHHDLLAEEIRELEEERDRDAQLKRIERYMLDRTLSSPSAYDRPRYLPPAPMLPPLIAPPRESQIMRQPQLSPYEDENYRRAVGERVLQQEWDMASARAATGGLQRAIAGPGVERRSTVGGRDREREKVYRDLRKRYPQ